MVVCSLVPECNPLVCSCRQLNRTAANEHSTALSLAKATTNIIHK